MCDSPDIIDFSQHAQVFPTPSLSWHIPDFSDQQIPINKESRARQDCGPANKKHRTRRECVKQKSSLPTCQSFVINNEKKKGLRLIQVQVSDISEQQEPASDNPDVVILSAQYVVTESVDHVMEETQSLINKISKQLCGDSCYY